MTERAGGLVVGTSGHIDHGKTAMVRALTGTDLDTLPEERERGITIALGFVALELPDGRRAAFVDVPGHERLVRTMIAGATGIDAVLLCISAVDGVMPQTREHLSILQLLGVSEGAVVLTMADLVDEELLELALDDARDLIEGTFLEGRPMVAFSAVTGRGRDELVEAIGGFTARGRDVAGPFRLPVDRAFSRPGFGTVVTGTAWSGTVDDGGQVVLHPGGRQARVRGIQTHGVSARRAEAGQRVALNLAGVDKSEVGRGVVVVQGDLGGHAMVDVHYHHLPGAPLLEDGASVRFLLGTTERLGRLHIAEDRDEIAPGVSLWAQLRLDGPVVCLPGDRFVLRRTSPVDTLGGGVVVDPFAPRMRRRDRERCGEQIARLHAGQTVVWLERAGEEGLDPAEWSRRAPGVEVGITLGDRVFAPPVVGRLEGALLDALTVFHADNPLVLGAHRRELRRGRLAHLPERVFDALVDRLAEAGAVRVEGPLLRVARFRVELSEEQRSLQGRVVSAIAATGLAGLSPKALQAKHGEAEVLALVRLAEADGMVSHVPQLGFVLDDELTRLRDGVRSWFSDHDQLTPQDFKQLTGLSRKSAIPLLEWMDRTKLTRRVGDARLAGPGARV